METLLQLGIFALSIGGLYFGADFLIRGSVQIANHFKISKMVIALTLVAAGTSMPEFFVTLLGALKGKPDISIGNIVGSNITNISLVLGVACLILPFQVKKRTLKLDYPIILFTTVLFYFFMSNLTIGRLEGVALFALFLFYIFLYLYLSRKQGKSVIPEEMAEAVEADAKPVALYKSFLWVLAGVLLLYGASEGLIHSAIFFARKMGLSEAVIGVTMVAVGTSIPEIFTSIIASLRKEDDISLGNVLGSNFLNVAMVVGLTSVIHPLQVNPLVIKKEALIMIGVTLVIFPLALARKFNRWSSLVLLSMYAGFVYAVFT